MTSSCSRQLAAQTFKTLLKLHQKRSRERLDKRLEPQDAPGEPKQRKKETQRFHHFRALERNLS